MIFGDIPVAQAEDANLAHTFKFESITFKKGRRLSSKDVTMLAAGGLESVIGARLEPDDVHEDEAAQAIADALLGSGLEASPAFTGRCNITSKTRGLFVIDPIHLSKVNLEHEAGQPPLRGPV
jgi:molybdenum cofactor cytidylyltransferase